MRVYNTLSGKIEAFEPHGQSVKIYACGITPYDSTHLGHAFTYTTIDVLIRYLEFLGKSVDYVQNITDVDDDILRKANEVDQDWKLLGDRWTARFIKDMIALNVRPPNHFPRATDVIPQVVEMVLRLIGAGVAYQSGGNVYFHIDAWPEYGKLSRLSRDEMLPIANERGNNPDDVHKQDPLDFVLWQARAPDEPAWDSPWGPGRPGWHIECSTLAAHYLGLPIDIHSGGADLEFPHHESEIAQAEGAFGKRPFVRYWIHTAMVHHEGEKMSKSLGNLLMVDKLLQSCSPDALRLYLASHHYRRPWSHDPAELHRSERMAGKLCRAVTADCASGNPMDASWGQDTFTRAMDDDLDAPRAIKALGQLAEQILGAGSEGHDVKDAQETLRSMGRIFGLRLDAQEPYQSVNTGWDRYLSDFT